MKLRKPMCSGTYAVLLCSISPLALAQTAPETTLALDPILVEGTVFADGPMSTMVNPEQMNQTAARDGGEILRAVPGITSGRMGGHGLEVVIRGQQQNQINVIDAGSFTYGACPNRMDPPTATASFNRADEIIVQKGYSSVSNGPGGSGGAVILKRNPPEFEKQPVFTGALSAGLASNGGGQDVAGRFTYNLGHGLYIQGAADMKSADNYADGSGREVRSAYDQRSAGVTVGYVGDGVDLAFDVEYDETKDVLFPGAGMDSPSDETFVYRLRGGIDVAAGALHRIEGTLYYSTVDHVMDNYSLRPVGAMAMRVPASSDTVGGKLEAQLSFGATEARIGVDYQSNNRDATAFMGMPAMIPMLESENPARAAFLMWPDVTIAQTGLYAETETTLSTATTLIAGLRYDYVNAKAGRASAVPALGASPNTFYTAQYGTTFNASREEHNFGGLLRLEHNVTSDTMIFAALSRSVRTADATERAMARSNWVGNPDINPEKHHQLDLGVQIDKGAWYINANAYADWVQDFILRDQFTVAGVTTYRNVDAELAGVEIAAGWEQNGWEIWGDATYTYGNNTTDSRALAQIPPLQGQISVAYGQDGWRGGARMNWATKQDRIDPARDPGVTPSYATLDLFGSYALSPTATLLAGVDNVLDETYANHLSRSNLFDPTVTQVNEPGRTIYVKLEKTF